MNAKTTIMFTLRVVVLTFLLFAIFSVNFLELKLDEQILAAPVAWLFVAFLDALVLSYPICRSRWSGLRLVLTVFFVFYGVMVLLFQIEMLAFPIIPAEELREILINGAIMTAIFSPLAVLIHGRMRGGKEMEPSKRLVMPLKEWIWKLVLIAFIYAIIFLLFGLIPMYLGGEAFQEYYACIQIPTWFLPFEMLRGLLFALFALPVIRMMKGKWWEAGLAVALLFSVLQGAGLLVPILYMPEVLLVAHFIEVTSENFLFGWVVVWLLTRHH
jgi:hypothetical protein